MAEIVVAGELLAEFVAAERGQGFDAPGLFEGPFPSGAPAIFAGRPRGSAQALRMRAASVATHSAMRSSRGSNAMVSTSRASVASRARPAPRSSRIATTARATSCSRCPPVRPRASTIPMSIPRCSTAAAIST